MPPLTPEDATLILDHLVGEPSFSTAAVKSLLAAVPVVSAPTPRLRRGVLLRRLAADPLAESSLETIHLLATLPATGSPIAAAHIAVAAFHASAAPRFDDAATALFARPDGCVRRAVGPGGYPALASDDVIATVDQFEAAVGDDSSQNVLRSIWGDRTAVEERVRELLAAEWASIGPSKLEEVAERIVGDGAVETWRAADDATRDKLRILAGEEKTREILSKLEEPTSSANPISTPAVEKVVETLKTSCADLHGVVEDSLPSEKIVADEVLAAEKTVADEVFAAEKTVADKGVNLNAEEVRGQPIHRGAAGPSTHNDKDQGPNGGKHHNLMDRNPTAQTYQWEESPDLGGPESGKQNLPSPASPSCRRRRTWGVLEEETLRTGVGQYGVGNWKDILISYPDVFIGRTKVDLKDKWRNMNER